MKNIIWIAAIVLAFAAGYFTRGAIQEKAADSPHAESIQQNNKINTQEISNEKLGAAAKTIFTAKENPTVQTSQKQNTSEAQTGAPTSKQVETEPAQAIDSNNAPAKKYPNEISDEEIDKVLPAPFNRSLKNNHGDLREKYKEFAESNQQSDWDKNMQNKLSDAISSSPYTKFINLESIQCKVNLCEIRLYETKDGAWSLIMAEMRLQDWWGFGGTSASGIPSTTPGTTGWYMLFPRR